MSKRTRTPDRDPNVVAFEMVRALEEATSHGDDEYTDGADKVSADEKTKRKTSIPGQCLNKKQIVYDAKSTFWVNPLEFHF